MKKKYIIPQSDSELLINSASVMATSAGVDNVKTDEMEGDAPERTFRPGEL